jgi:uncharacterized protein
MSDGDLLILTAAVFMIAMFYSSVGHAGASGYIAVMALMNLPGSVIKPTALMLNIVVATIGAFQFWRAGYFQWRLFWPFALLAIPCAYLGGSLNVPAQLFKWMLGVVLLFSALRFLLRPPDECEAVAPRVRTGLGTGALLGLLAGMTGTGGGIFLSPLMIWRRWGGTKTVAAVAAMFILVNSLAGLTGHLGKTGHLPTVAGPLLVAVMLGGWLGSHLSCHRFSIPVIKRLLATVLLSAGTKLLLS